MLYTSGPEAALANTFLAGGYYALVFLLQGDCKHNQLALGFPDVNSVHKPCGLCCANSSDMMWTDFGDNDVDPVWLVSC